MGRWKKNCRTYASKVKNNIQLSRESEVSKKFTKFIIEKLNKDQLIKKFSLSKKIHGTIFTKSIKGMKYGRHIDNTFMSSGRADYHLHSF